MKKLTKPKPTKNCCQAAKVSKPTPEKIRPVLRQVLALGGGLPRLTK